MSRLRTTSLFALVCGAAIVLAGAVIWQVVAGTLRASAVDPGTASVILRALITALAALGVILIAVAIVAGRAYARSLSEVRAFILAHSRGQRVTAAPDFAVRELSDVVSAVERLSAHVSTREAHAEREGAEKSVLLDAISEGILQLDGAGRLVRANPAARALLGLTDGAVGKPVTAHIRHAQLRGLLEQAVSGRGVAAAEIAVDERRVIVSARPLAGAGNAGGTVVAFVDLTEVRRLENVRRDFVANVSHELKTPLTSIRGYVETLLTDDDLPAGMQRQFLTVVQKNADRLHQIVDDLLDLSRLESGGWRPELRAVDVNDVIDDVWSSCSDRARDRRIAFEHAHSDLNVLADPGGLRQVLFNLLDNALRYTPDGGRIEVRVAARDVVTGMQNGVGARRVEAARADAAPPAGIGSRGYIVFEVRDNGSGIPTEALPRVFERFYRVDPARSRAEGGTGLGLSIVKHLVESMGGDITAESELGKGTVIRFRLPAAQDDAPRTHD